jgi:NitT/TauT family transport system permease protein
MSKGLFRAGQSVASVLVLIGLWQMAVAADWVDLRFFPPPTEILRQCYEHLLYGDLLFDLRLSAWRIVVGSIVAIPLGLAAALLTELNPSAGAIARPWINFFYPLPKLAVLPLFFFFLGIGEGANIALVAFGVFFLVLNFTAKGVRRILNSEYYDVALVYRVPLFRRLFRVLLRGAMPEIMVGIRHGIVYALGLVIATEFVAGKRGLGVFVWKAWGASHILDLYSGLLLIGILGWVIFYVLSGLERSFSHND